MSLSNKSLNTAKKNKNNEFYTTFEHMECLFQHPQLDSVFRDKVIYLPCDTEESKIYQYLLKRKDELQIKEILRTSDDYYSHLDLYEKADIVFTNPPFTGLRKYVRWLEEDLNKKFILFASWQSFFFFERFWDNLLLNKTWKILNNRSFENIPYILQDGSKKSVGCFVFTNIDNIKHIRRQKNIRDIQKQKSLKCYLDNKKEHIYFRDDSILYIKNALYYPNDYYGEASIQPATFNTYINDLEFIKKETGGRYIVKRKKQTDEEKTN